MVSRLLSLLVAVAALTASFGLHAVPLEFVPRDLHAEPEAGGFAIPTDAVLPHELGAALISEQAFDALLISETRTRRLADGGERSEQTAKGSPRRRAASARPPAPEDPLALALEQMFARGGHRADPAAATPAPLDLQFVQGDESRQVLSDDAALPVDLGELRQGLAHALVAVLSPVLGAEGEVRFTLAGTGGASRTLAALFGEYKPVERPESSSGPVAPGADEASPTVDGPREAVERLLWVIWGVISHPVALGMLIVVVAAHLLRALGFHRPAY